MVGFLKAIVLLPVAILVVLLAVANREAVTLSFDPFSGGAPEFSLTLPLFAILFAAVMIGVVVGGTGAWLGQSHHRRARRQSAREVTRLRGEVERRRDYATGRSLTAPGLPTR